MKKSILAISLSLLSVAVGQSAINRKLLVIGNDNYQHASTLRNARNDAKSVAVAFGGLGYSVTTATDVTLVQMDQAITMFSQSLVPGDIALLYYSGHGFQVDGENYLVPIDFSAATASEGKQQAFSLSSILGAMTKRGARTQVIVLDACRNNPFFSSRSTQAGWADVGISEGTLIAFGTSPGSTASDNPSEPNGLFTKMFLSHLSSQLPIEDVLKMVRADTIAASVGAQTPWIASSLIGELHLDPKAEGKSISGERLSLSDSLASSNITNSRAISRRSAGHPELDSPSNPNSEASADILISQGMQLAREGDYAEACRSLSAAVAIRPASSLALRLIGLIFYAMGRGADALAQFSRAIEANPSDHLAYLYRCSASTNSDPPSAIRDCQAAIGIKADFVDAHLALANALLVDGQRDQAMKVIGTAITLSPGLAPAYALRGKINNSIGNYEAGSRDIRTAIRLSSQTDR